MTNNQQPGWPQQPDNQPYGNPGGQPGDQPNQGTTFMKPPPKKGLPVWGWAAGGVGIAAVIAVAGALVFNGLESNQQPNAVPDPSASETAAPEKSASEELADAGATETDIRDVYTFDDAGFSGPPVWSVKEPQGWSTEPVKEGMVNYTNASLQCTFTTYQATIEPTGGSDDEAATAQVMATEIEAVRKSLGKPVEVIDDAESLYVTLRDGEEKIEMQEAELRFKNGSGADVIYRMAVRATSSSNGLMELALACPADLVSELQLWVDLTDRVSMMDPA